MNPIAKPRFISKSSISIILLLISVSLQASDSLIYQLLDKFNSFNLKFPQEKVYLHLDRSSYWTKDTIWFKAYLKDSPIFDCNLNIELSNSAGAIVFRKMYWAQHGLAYGDIELPDTLSGGVYQIKAYTNWMRNFDKSFFFTKNFIIWNLKDKAITDEGRELAKHDATVEFFPEGGTFIAGIKSKVAFKATDQNGKGLDVKGSVFDDKGNKIVDFNSLKNGMGNFMIQPSAGAKYTAKITIANSLDMKVDLPSPQKEGIAISIDPFDEDSVKVHISTINNPILNDSVSELYLVAQTNNTILWQKKIQTANGVANLFLPKEKFPTGIIKLTLFSSNLVPLCERLFFINHNDFVRIEIIPDKKEYSKREKVNLVIKASQKDRTPCLANMSLSVYNSDNELKYEDYPSNILTYFLLSSELKGNIENPSYYFKDGNLSTQQALDNVMLTHGYRCFEWKDISTEAYSTITYQPEDGIIIKGTVKTFVQEKPVPYAKVNLCFLKWSLGFHQTNSDSLGNFEFPSFYFNDTVSFSLDAQTEKKKKSYWVTLDKNSINFPNNRYQISNSKFTDYHYEDDLKVKIINSFNNEELQKLNRKWKLTDTIMLNEVQVAAKKKTNASILFPLRLYDKADWNLILNNDDDELGSIFPQLEDKFSGVVVRANDKPNSTYIRIDNQKNDPVLVLNGKVLDDGFIPGGAMKLINSIPRGNFEKVEILKNGSMYGNMEGGAICFFTKKGALDRTTNVVRMKNTTIIGYSVIRKFYSPEYKTQLPFEIKDDFRNTLYWNPIVRTNSVGIAHVSFYNSDQSGDIKIVVEGVTDNGKLCRGVSHYSINK